MATDLGEGKLWIQTSCRPRATRAQDTLQSSGLTTKVIHGANEECTDVGTGTL